MNLKKFKIDFKNKKRLIPQVLTISFIIFVIAYFSYNAQINMGNRGISFGYGFLSQEASFDITFSMIDYDGSYSYGRAFLVGLLNTLLVSIIGIILCTITRCNYRYWTFITKLI
jgi:general L-amino acid transport system permease protein